MDRSSFANKILIIVMLILLFAAGRGLVFSKEENAPPSYSVKDNTLSVNLDGYYQTCINSAALYKRVNSLWEKISDELPVSGLYYLDDKFVGYSLCDYVVCTELPKPYTIKLVEYKKIGGKTPPPDSGSDVATLPAYETIALSGDIKIEIQYFSDKNCRGMKTISTIIRK